MGEKTEDKNIGMQAQEMAEEEGNHLIINTDVVSNIRHFMLAVGFIFIFYLSQTSNEFILCFR